VKVREDDNILAGWLGLNEAAAQLGMRPRTLSHYLNDKTDAMPHIKLGNRKFVVVADVRAWLEARSKQRNPSRLPPPNKPNRPTRRYSRG
jgi:hypothetical protein